MIPILAWGLALVACQSEDDLRTGAGEGRVAFSVDVPVEIKQVQTRAESGYALPSELVPAAQDFALQMTGSYLDEQNLTQTYQNSWVSVSAYNTENPDLQAGTYSATFTHGQRGVEGEGKPYFAGELTSFEVKANKTLTYPVVCKMANSCFTLQVTEWMLNYYDEISLTIHTATSDFTFTMNSQEATTLTFVNPAQVLSISGTAIKAQNGVAVEFPKTAIGSALVAETLYAITVDHGTAGAGALSISFDGSFTEVPEVEIELNPEV